MAEQTTKQATGTTVRIWSEAKEQVQEMVEAKTKRERRPVSEAEVVSKAVNAMHRKEKKKLGI